MGDNHGRDTLFQRMVSHSCRSSAANSPNSHYFSLPHRLCYVGRLVMPTLEPHTWALSCTPVCITLKLSQVIWNPVYMKSTLRKKSIPYARSRREKNLAVTILLKITYLKKEWVHQKMNQSARSMKRKKGMNYQHASSTGWGTKCKCPPRGLWF